jgi:uncharacterized membrane protein
MKRYIPPFLRGPGRAASLPAAHLIAWGMVLAYIVTFTWLAILRHAGFGFSGFDLGVYDQVVWNTLHGRIFFYTTTGQPLLHLSNHADPILLLVAPFYLIYSGPEMLLFLQAAAIGLGGLPLFWLGREKLGSDLAGLSLLAAYLLFPALQIINLWDFHPPALATGFLMYAFYFLEKRKAPWFLLFAVLAMGCKEQISLLVVFMGLYAILRHRDWRLGGAAVGLGVAWFVVVMYWVIPAYSVKQESLFLWYYSDLGDSPLEIVLGALARPDVVLSKLVQPSQVAYLRDVLTPFGYLSLVGLPVLLIGLPSLAINLLSSNPAMRDATRGHYTADVAPWLAWGAVYGMVALRQGLARLWPRLRPEVGRRPWLTWGLSVALLTVSLTWHLFRGFTPLALDAPHWEVTAHDRLAQRFMAQIPPDAPLSAQGKLYPHLSDRMIAYQFPDINEAEYVFLDATLNSTPLHPNDMKAKAMELLETGQFGVQDAADGYILLRRGQGSSTLPDAFYDFARVREAHPQYPLRVEFGDKLRLVGYDVLDDPRREETSVRLYWQALRALKGEVRLYPFFVNEAGEVVEDTTQRPLITQLWYPPREWKVGETVVSETLAWAVGQRWSLGVGVLEGKDWTQWNERLRVKVAEGEGGEALRRFEAATWVRLGTFERQGRALVAVASAGGEEQPAQVVEAEFGRQMALRGYTVSPVEARAGQEVAVTLYWRGLTPMSVDYTVFVHLVGADGQRVAQQDGEPWWEVKVPTSTWQVGEELQDRHVLKVPEGVAPGEYRLQMGVYYWQTQERLPVQHGDAPPADYLELGSVTIK